MRKVLVVLGAVFVVIIVAGGIAVFVLAQKGAGLDRESKAYVDDAVVAITANWNSDELLRRATPQLRATIKLEDLKTFFDGLSALGHLQEYEGSKGQANVMMTTGSGTTISANYEAKARYQKGPATFQIVLMKIDDHWMIHGFHVDSSALATALGRRS